MLLFAVFTLGACSEKSDLKLLYGKYAGDYFYVRFAESEHLKSELPIAVEIDKNKGYFSSGNPDRKPAGGSGKFSLEDENIINFKDKNIWTQDFDARLILNGRFTYEFKGDSLILTRYVEPCPYCNQLPSFFQYRLKRLD